MVEERETQIYQKSYPAIGEIMSGGADFFPGEEPHGGRGSSATTALAPPLPPTG